MIEQTRLGASLRTTGWWTPQRDQVDPTIPYLPLEDPPVTGTGSLVAQVAGIDGTGLSTSLGTDGVIASQVSTLSGSGTVGTAGISGTGTLLSSSSALDGAGLSLSSGSGSLSAASAALDGTGLSAVTGSGVLEAGQALLEGVGSSGSFGTGVLLALASIIAGVGAVVADSEYDWRNRRHRRQVAIIKKKR